MQIEGQAHATVFVSLAPGQEAPEIPATQGATPPSVFEEDIDWDWLNAEENTPLQGANDQPGPSAVEAVPSKRWRRPRVVVDDDEEVEEEEEQL